MGELCLLFSRLGRMPNPEARAGSRAPSAFVTPCHAARRTTNLPTLPHHHFVFHSTSPCCTVAWPALYHSRTVAQEASWCLGTTFGADRQGAESQLAAPRQAAKATTATAFQCLAQQQHRRCLLSKCWVLVAVELVSKAAGM